MTFFLTAIRSMQVLTKAVEAVLLGHAMSRKQRREIQRKLLKSNQPTPTLRKVINSVDPQGSVDEVVRKYPMRPADALTLGQYFIGNATREEADTAFLESLRDPRWMMRWFAEHHERMTPISDWVRSPSKSIASTMRDAAAMVKELRIDAAAKGEALKSAIFTTAGMRQLQDAMVKRVANHVLASTYPASAAIDDVQRLDEQCPSLTTAVRALHSVMFSSVAADRPRQPLESDFVDALHAMYAPHVDLFRADRFMAPHIQKLVTRYGTTVVPSLLELPALISARLEAIG
jgi:hypothetical protein